MKFCDYPTCKQPVFSGDKCFRHYPRQRIKREKRPRIRKVAYGRKEIADYSKSQIKKDLNTIFCAYIRMRDADSEGMVKCISSQRPLHWSHADAGHFIPRSVAPALIFHPDNVHAQSKIDNWHEGNRLEYRKNLVSKIGLKKVEEMEILQHQKSGLGIFEYRLLLLQYIEKFEVQCKRLNYTPNITQQRVIERWKKK